MEFAPQTPQDRSDPLSAVVTLSGDSDASGAVSGASRWHGVDGDDPTTLFGIVALGALMLLLLLTACQTPHEPQEWEPISEAEAADNLNWFRSKYYDKKLSDFLNQP